MTAIINNGSKPTIMVRVGRLNILRVWVQVQLKNSKNILLRKSLFTLNMMEVIVIMRLIWLLIKNERMIEKIGWESMTQMQY